MGEKENEELKIKVKDMKKEITEKDRKFEKLENEKQNVQNMAEEIHSSRTKLLKKICRLKNCKLKVLKRKMKIKS